MAFHIGRFKKEMRKAPYLCLFSNQRPWNCPIEKNGQRSSLTQSMYIISLIINEHRYISKRHLQLSHS